MKEVPHQWEIKTFSWLNIEALLYVVIEVRKRQASRHHYRLLARIQIHIRIHQINQKTIFLDKII